MEKISHLKRSDKDVFTSESKLEDYVVKHPDVLEEGVRVILRQRKTKSSGIPDIVCIDSDNHLIVCEIKNEEATSEALGQACTYLEWALKNTHYLEQEARKKFKKNDLTLQTENPRLVLVAASYDKHVKNLAVLINEVIPLKLIEYETLDENGALKPLFQEVHISELDISENPPPSEDQVKEWIGKKLSSVYEDMKKQASNIFKSDVEPRPRRSWEISLHASGRRICTLGFAPRKEIIHIWDKDGDWFSFTVHGYQKEKNKLIKKLQEKVRKMEE